MAKIYEVHKKDGSIIYRSKVYLGIDPGTGVKKYTTLSDKSPRELQAKIDKYAVTRRNNQGRTTRQHRTYLEVYNEFIKIYEATVKPNTFQTTLIKYKRAVLPYLSHYRIDKITTQICQNYVNKLAEERRAGHYRFTHASLLNMKVYANMVLIYALKHKYITENPMQFVEVPKRDTEYLYSEDDRYEQRKYWLKDEVYDFLELAKKEMVYEDFVFFRLLLFSGMRKGEALALNWKDINLKTHEIWIGKTLACVKGVYYLQKPKTPSSVRTIIIDDITLQYLLKWQTMEKALLMRRGQLKRWDGLPCFVGTKSCDHLAPAHLNLQLEAFYRHHPDFYRITVHQMRHTHASLLFEANASLKDVQAKLGHANIQTTMNIYTHVTKTKVKQVQAKFSDFMGF